MIVGSVNANSEAVMRLEVRGSEKQGQSITAVVDTGFNGSLTLSPAQTESLGLT